MQLRDIRPGDRLKGVLQGETVQVVSAQLVGEDALDLVFRSGDGTLGQQILYPDSLVNIAVERDSLPWQFDADAEAVRLASEAYRIKLAHLFDPHLAIHTSMIQPLPHQITAVYGEMLPRQPLRFLLADDPGAGKTIMAGLLIKELMLRGDLTRCLIVCPGNLVEQWQDELYSRFQLEFDIMTNDRLEASVHANAFLEVPLCIARLDKLARDDDVKEKLKATEWDLIICDEAHKMSATVFGNEEKRTKRYNLGMLLSGITRHFLLLTATPHNGKDEDFYLFMKLLDHDRFEGRRRNGEKADVSDLMRRLIKEQLVTFEGKPLFPERIAYTVAYELSPLEKQLYDEVTEYVRSGFDKAMEVLEPDKAHAVGFALTILQRRLASSPEAIYQSLRRRRERLEKRKDELVSGATAAKTLTLTEDEYEDLEEAPEEELAEIEEKFLDEATAARTVAELETEISWLRRLEELAKRLRNSGEDRKWDQLSKTLHDNVLRRDGAGAREKIIIFTEHRDTLNYLTERIRTMLGNRNAVVTLQGGMRREERRMVEESFKNDPAVYVLVATDAAGEGINLQRAHLMINYDLPWNPNRIEQRFGRIHRIGQKEVCCLWNLVAMGTREGDVFRRLFEKLDRERQALGGRVFDVLGKVTFGEKPLRDLLIEAIRYGNSPEVRARLEKVIDDALDRQRLEKLLEERALAGQALGLNQVRQIREEMERIEARRLQPHYIESFFLRAYERLGGQVRRRANRRYHLPHVPAALRRRRSATGALYPVARSYEAITFEKQQMQLPGQPDAALICPGHPLLSALIDEVLDDGQELLKRGTVFIDNTGLSNEDRLLFYIEDVLEDGRRDSVGRPVRVSHRLHFVEITRSGQALAAGYAPYLDYAAPTEEELKAVKKLLESSAWWGRDAEKIAREYAIRHLTPAHLKDVRERKNAFLDKVEREVKSRLEAEIAYWDAQAGKMYDQAVQGKQGAHGKAEQYRQRVQELERRLECRLEELKLERGIVARPPTVLGGAWVVPRAMLERAMDRENMEQQDSEAGTAVERTAVERAAVEAVMYIERSLGNVPKDVGAEKLGYDVESSTPDGSLRFIEVKGRQIGENTVTVTHNEMLLAVNKPSKSILAIVEVDGNRRRLTYFRNWVRQAPEFADVSHTLEIKKLRQVDGIEIEFETELLV